MSDVAVILLPGILGSPLENKITHEDIWPVHSTGRTVWTGWSHTAKKVKLFVDDIRTLNSVTEALRPTKWEAADVNLAAPIYHEFVQLAATQRVDTAGNKLGFTPHVYVLNYDWSASTINNISNIHAGTVAIRNAALRDHGATKFMYVTHSMGVLAALATALDRDWANHSEFAGIVAVAGPIRGAPEALMRMMRGFPSPGSLNLDAFMAFVTSKLLSNSGWKFSMLAPVLPGFADLLPWSYLNRNLEREIEAIINFHFDPNNPVIRGFGLRTERSWSEASIHRATLVGRMQESVKLAQALHRFILSNQHQLSDRNKLYAVCLTGKDTIQSMTPVNLTGVTSLRGARYGNLNIPTVLNGTYTFANTGDATVTEGGQKYNFPVYTTVPGGIDHADAFKNKDVWPHIHTGMQWIYKQISK